MRRYAPANPLIPVFLFLALSAVSAGEPRIAIEVGDALAPPGAKNVPVPVRILPPEGISVQGWQATFSYDPAIIEEAWVEDASSSEYFNFFRPEVYLEPGLMGVGSVFDMMFPMDERVVTAPGKTVAHLRLCLKPDAPAGTYPLGIPIEGHTEGVNVNPVCTVNATSITDLDLRGGSLTILGDPADPAECLGPDAPPPPPPPPDHPVHAAFMLTSLYAAPGDAFRMPFVINADHGIAAFSFSIDFDEGILQATEIEEVFEKPDGKDYDFRNFHFDNSDANPGNGGVDEGFLAGMAILSWQDQTMLLPADTDVEVLAFHFFVKPDAQAGSTEIAFINGASFGGSVPIGNVATISGTSVHPTGQEAMVFMNGRATIEPDIAIFVRGDATADGEVDLSDPILTLYFLFQGGDAPRCLDAADSNDDGAIDITDPISTLVSLFLGAPMTGGSPDRDWTPDGLSCRR
jgi:hypothetical protein